MSEQEIQTEAAAAAGDEAQITGSCLLDDFMTSKGKVNQRLQLYLAERRALARKTDLPEMMDPFLHRPFFIPDQNQDLPRGCGISALDVLEAEDCTKPKSEEEGVETWPAPWPKADDGAGADEEASLSATAAAAIVSTKAIDQVFMGGPAAQTGLLSVGDVITQVDGKLWSSISDHSEAILGPEGSTVELKVKKPAGGEIMVKITREPALRGVLAAAARGLGASGVTALFSKYDSDGDKRIDVGEMRKILGEMGVESREEEVTHWLRQARLDGDGRLDLEAFRHLVGLK